MRPALALLLLSLIAYAPQLLFGEWRGTEARRVEIAREMYLSGDWMVPTLGLEPTLAKPPLFYWLLAALHGVGSDPWLLRLPSVLAFWLLALVSYFPLRRHYSDLSAAIGAAGILVAPIALDHVAYAEIDPLFAALTAISIVWLAEGASFSIRWKLVAAGVFGGLAMLCKGPPYLMFLAGSALVWGRRLRLSGARWFVPPLVLVPAAYYVPLLLLRVSPSEMLDVAGSESVGRVSLFGWQHIVSTPYYFLVAGAVLMPLGLWTFHEYRGDREMRHAGVVGPREGFLRICAGAMVSAILVLALFPARPGRYLLPGVPCFLVALGPAIAAYARFGRAPSMVLGPAVRALGIAGCLGVVATPWLPYPYDQRTPFLCAALAVAPLFVRGRRDVIVYALVMPVIAAWTLLPDRNLRRATPPRSEALAAEILARELDQRGVDDDLSTYGHVPSEVLLARDRIPPGDEFFARSPASRWVLHEEPGGEEDATAERLEGYVERLRLQLDDKTLVLQRRR